MTTRVDYTGSSWMSGGAPRVLWPYSAAVACLALGLGLAAETIVLTLNPDCVPVELASALLGARMLKALLVADGVLLFVLPYLKVRPAAAPLWTPVLDTPKAGWAARHFTGLLCALLAAAAALRLVALNTDLWMDEVFTLVRTVRPPAGRLLAVFVDDNQHTLYSLLAKGSVAAFGESPAALRLPAVVFGLAGIAATAHLAAYVFGRREALLAAALLALSYHHVWFSQNARAYTILLCVASLSSELLLRALESRRQRYWLLYAAVIAAGTLAHLSAILLAVAHALVVATLYIRKRADPWQPAAAFALAAWLTLHAYAVVIPQMYAFFSQPGAGSSPGSEWTSPVWLLRETLGPVGWAGLILAIPAAFALRWLARRDWVFFAFTLAPALLAGAMMLALGRSLWPRSFFHLLGLAAIAAAALAIAAWDWLASRRPHAHPALRLAPGIALCLLSLAALPAVYRYPKQDYTGARDFVVSQLGPSDHVAALHMAGRVYSLYYAPQWRETNTIEELEAIQSPNGRTWVIYTLPSYLDSKQPELAALLRRDYEPVRTFPGTLGDGDLFVLRSKPR